MKKTIAVILSIAVAGLFGENLVKQGDFTQLKNLNGHAMTNGGRASVFTEDYTWNKCAKLEIDKVVKTAKNTELTAACIWLGCDSKNGGFPVKPDTTYRFTVELKGSRPLRVTIGANLWEAGKGVWQGKAVRSSIGSVNISSEWKKYSGTFKTGKKSAKAALQIQMWHDTQYGPHKFKVGDYVLIDNVTVEETRTQMNAAPAAQIPEVPAKKSALITDTAEAVRDFRVLRDAAKKSELTSFSVRKKDNALQISIECQEPGKIVVGKGVWDGDAVEIFFVRNGRIMQFAASAGGALFSTDKLPWKADCRVEKDKWSVAAEIPFSSLGGKLENGDTISFNLARQRLNAKEFLTWSDLKESFHESDRFGMLVMGDYGAAFEKQYGKKLAGSGRDAYEKACAAEETERLKRKFAKLAKRKFAAVPVPVTGNFAVPFVPDEVFDPVEKIDLNVAVNELKALPVAVMNLTDKTADYRVILETDEKYIGSYGLKDFPAEKIIQRFAVRFKDNDKDAGSLRYDPLPKIGEACTISVPPKEAGLVWFDFDSSDVKPGVYRGRLRIIPLSEPASWTPQGNYHNRKYTGEMQDIPVTLTVRNAVLPKDPPIPMNFFQWATAEGFFRGMVQCGSREFGLNPWNFKFRKTGRGKLDLSGTAGMKAQLKSLRSQLEWAKKYQIKPAFFIGFGAYGVCKQSYGAECWGDWIRGVKKFMNENGVPDSDYIIETWDEPRDKDMPEILKSHQAAKQAEPTVRLEVTLAHWTPSIAHIKALKGYIDAWCLWGTQYFEAPFKAVFEDYRKSGTALWHYMCSTSMRENLFRYYRRIPWTAAYYDLDAAYMFWFMDNYGGIGASDWKVATAGGICYRSFDNYIPSIRYMAIREGVTDLKYLSLVKDPVRKRAYLKRLYITNAHDPKEPDRVRE
ncbi:MAG: hypothetical protein E7055_00005 [Lentisphaerae bacterium]|nr:hypothetical protein [Lentisphaerota bacterium]